MYPYHNKIKQRIRAGELIGFQFVDDYPNIGEALVLHFNTVPFLRPIRPHRYPEYVDLLVDWKKAPAGFVHDCPDPSPFLLFAQSGVSADELAESLAELSKSLFSEEVNELDYQIL